MGTPNAPVQTVGRDGVGADPEGGVSVSKLPSGRWRAQVHDPSTGHNVSVSKILGPPGTFKTKAEAKAARAKARVQLSRRRATEVTVRAFWERWTTDPIFARPKASSDVRRRELTKAFVDRYGNVPIDQIGDEIVAEWLAGGRRNGTVMGLRSLFNDARKIHAGHLVDRNPFERLGISRGPGRRDQQPPAEEMVWSLIGHAHRLVGDSFGAWLQVAAFTGMRPGELDALRWTRVDFERSRIDVAEQFNATTRTFDTPKNHQRRDAPLTHQARAALLTLPRQSEFCFVSLRGSHWTTSSRAYHWKSVRAAAGYEGSVYLATRHFAGWYMVNVLEMPSEDVAIALGHTDGGELVRRLYGHRDKDRALDRVVNAYRSVGNVTPLRAVTGDDAS
jgi:integrase